MDLSICTTPAHFTATGYNLPHPTNSNPTQTTQPPQIQLSETRSKKLNQSRTTGTEGKVPDPAEPQGQERTVRTAEHSGHSVRITGIRLTCNNAGEITEDIGITLEDIMKNYWNCRRRSQADDDLEVATDSTRSEATKLSANDRLSNYRTTDRGGETTGQGPAHTPSSNSWLWIMVAAAAVMTIGVVAIGIAEYSHRRTNGIPWRIIEKTGSDNEESICVGI